MHDQNHCLVMSYQKKNRKTERQTLPWTLNKNNCPDALSSSQLFKHTTLSLQSCKYMGAHAFTALGTNSLTDTVQTTSTTLTK